jgi:homoserine O-succinyltransferase/O-acetyltransferase
VEDNFQPDDIFEGHNQLNKIISGFIASYSDSNIFAADFRWWQVTQPNKKVFSELGAEILALEKIRLHVDYERAIMAIRISPEICSV